MWKGCVWEGVGDRTELQHIDPHSYGHQCFFPVLLMLLNRRPPVPTLLGAGFLFRILSPTGLVSKLTDFLSSSSYIIVQSPTQYLPINGHRNVSLPPSLEWHVWSSSSRNNCHAVHRSLTSGVSLCDSMVGFLPCPILSTQPAYTISSNNWPSECVSSAVFGMACLAGSKVNVQHYTTFRLRIFNHLLGSVSLWVI